MARLLSATTIYTSILENMRYYVARHSIATFLFWQNDEHYTIPFAHVIDTITVDF